MDADIIIVGAGPAGLCLAKRLSGRQLKVIVLEQQNQDLLEAPQFDGREIALTQHSAKLMQDMGLWDLIDRADIAPLVNAKVIDDKNVGTAEFFKIEIGDDIALLIVVRRVIWLKHIEPIANS